MFQGVHSTVIGDSHIRKGIVCQDSSGTVVTDKFAIAVVADGHGSAKHFRSLPSKYNQEPHIHHNRYLLHSLIRTSFLKWYHIILFHLQQLIISK